MNYKKLILLTTVFIFFTACSPQYNITPKYNEKDKIVSIDNFEIEHVLFKNKKTKTDVSGVSSQYDIFKVDNNICTEFIHIYQNVPNNMFFLTSSIEDVLLRYKNNCKIEKIGNINFYSCTNKEKVIENNNKYSESLMNYGLTISYRNEYGYSNKSQIFFGTNYKCFNKIKNHFKMKTDPKYIEVTNQF